MYQIIYFTRSGDSKRIAETLAERLHSELIEITDSVDWSGIKGYFKYVWYKITGKRLSVSVRGKISDSAELIVVTPIWDANPALAVRWFLRDIPRNRVHIVTSSKVSALRDRRGYISIHEFIRRANNEEAQLAACVEELSRR